MMSRVFARSAPRRAADRFGSRLRAPLALFACLALAACGGGGSETVYPDDDRLERGGSGTYDTSADVGLAGPGGLDLFGSGGGDDAPAGGTGIGVNAFLWRASLDTVSFMPLASADPFGGVIITDWYSPPESPNERFKVNVFILGRELRADGVRARVFRQVAAVPQATAAGGGGPGWQDAPVGDTTGTELEDAILTRARELRISALN
jgi:hypothetical protein